MGRDEPFARVVVPNHQCIDTGTLDHILDGADCSVGDFIKLLR
jgi:hypothetical protein